MTAIRYAEETIGAAEFADILERSGLAERRPAGDLDRLQRMIDGANLIVTARDEAGLLIGVARSIADGAYICYLSDLAVDRAWQGKGVGTALIAETRRLAGPECACLLLSAPDAESFYERIGMPRNGRAFLYSRER